MSVLVEGEEGSVGPSLGQDLNYSNNGNLNRQVLPLN